MLSHLRTVIMNNAHVVCSTTHLPIPKKNYLPYSGHAKGWPNPYLCNIGIVFDPPGAQVHYVQCCCPAFIRPSMSNTAIL